MIHPAFLIPLPKLLISEKFKNKRIGKLIKLKNFLLNNFIFKVD